MWYRPTCGRIKRPLPDFPGFTLRVRHPEFTAGRDLVVPAGFDPAFRAYRARALATRRRDRMVLPDGFEPPKMSVCKTDALDRLAKGAFEIRNIATEAMMVRRVRFELTLFSF